MDKIQELNDQLELLNTYENNSKLDFYNEINLEHERCLNEAVEFVNEAYVGKTPILLQIEDQINQIRGKITQYDDFDADPEVQKLNRLFEQQFGMDVFALHIDPHNTINAYTMTLSKSFEMGKINYSKWIIADRKDGFKFKPNNGFCISSVVYYGLFNHPDLTDGEVLATILHELGHNFADFIDDKIKIQNRKIMKSIESAILMDTILIIICTAGIATIPAIALYKHRHDRFSNDVRRKKEQQNQNRKYSKTKGKTAGRNAKVNDFFDTLGSVMYKYNPINRIFARISHKSRQLYADELKQSARKSLDRRNEIIADKFAGVYGYGPELGSALDKMGSIPSNSSKWISRLPGGDKVNKFWEEIYKDINEFDCHPHHIQRINENIKLLKDELNQEEMDPKMKKVILDQIKELENLVKDISTRVNKNPNSITAAYDAFVNEKLPDATTKKIEDEITEEFNKIMSKKK